MSAYDGKTSRKMFVEAFVRPEPFFYNVVPGIGLGLEFDEQSLAYVCLDTRKSEKDRSFSIYFLASGALDSDFWSNFRSKQVTLSHKNIRTRPTSIRFSTIQTGCSTTAALLP